MTSAKRVLVVGGTGNLGGKIVRELVAAGTARVRVTTRDPNKPEAAALQAPGVELATADLGDADSLERACDGIDVVVSAIQGLADIIVDGQTRLLRAAEARGVRRMLPSDYALDFFKTTPGKNRNLDLRRDFNRVLDGSTRVRGTSVLCGAFMDLISWGAIGPDPKTGVYRVWGSPDQRYDFTLTDDLAKYVAAAALDDSAGRFVRVAGDSQTARALATIFEAARGTPVTLEAAGSLADLDALIERMQAEDMTTGNTFPRWQQLQYTRDMASGDGVLEPLDNARYPAIHPVTVRELLARPRQSR